MGWRWGGEGGVSEEGHSGRSAGALLCGLGRLAAVDAGGGAPVDIIVVYGDQNVIALQQARLLCPSPPAADCLVVEAPGWQTSSASMGEAAAGGCTNACMQEREGERDDLVLDGSVDSCVCVWVNGTAVDGRAQRRTIQWCPACSRKSCSAQRPAASSQVKRRPQSSGRSGPRHSTPASQLGACRQAGRPTSPLHPIIRQVELATVGAIRHAARDKGIASGAAGWLPVSNP